MEATEYNTYLLNLHKDCALSCINPTGSFDTKLAANTFDVLAENFNNTIASQMLNQLSFSKKNKNIIGKLEDYPYMFWQTNAGKEMIVNERTALEESYIIELEDKLKNYNTRGLSAPIPMERKNRDFTAILNSGLAEGKDQYGEGLLQKFAKNTLKLHLMVGENIPTIENIKKYATKVVEIIAREQLDIELNDFSTYIKKIFKNTAIANDVKEIDFEAIFNNKSTNTRTLKV